jgi:hypothetical protein
VYWSLTWWFSGCGLQNNSKTTLLNFRNGGPMADWRQVYEAAVYERDAVMLTRLLHEVERLAFNRAQELVANPDPEESRAIQLAHAHLLTIKAERLGWPDPRNSNRHCGSDKKL